MDFKLFMVYEIIGRKILFLNEFQQRVCVYVLDYFAANIPISSPASFSRAETSVFLFSATKERTTQSSSSASFASSEVQGSLDSSILNAGL